MHPSHVVTAVHFAALDLGRQLQRPFSKMIGVATFSSRVEGGGVTLALDTIVTRAIDPDDILIRWLDDRLREDRATLAGYRLHRAIRTLGMLPTARWSPALRCLAGRGDQLLIDMRALGPRRRILPFRAMCAALDVPCSKPAEVEHFTAWATGRTDPIAHTLAIDVITVWRLAMQRLAQQTSGGLRFNRLIEEHLARWLSEVDLPAARIHLASLQRAAE